MIRLEASYRLCQLPGGLAYGRLALAIAFGMLEFGCWTHVHYSGSTEPEADSSTAGRSDETSTELANSSHADHGDPFVDDAPGVNSVGKPTTVSSVDIQGDPFADVQSVLPKKQIRAPSESEPPNADVTPLPFERPLEPPPSVGEAAPAPMREGDRLLDSTSEALVSDAAATKAPADLADDLIPIEPVSALSSVTSTRHASWLLGSKLSLAALAPEIRSPPIKSEVELQEAQLLADTLSLPIPVAWPPPAKRPEDTSAAAIVESLLPLGRKVGRDIYVSHGPEHAAMFEIAFKSNLLLVLYEPGSPFADSLSVAIQSAAQRGGLPHRLWQPLLETVAHGAKQADVDRAVYAMHRNVDVSFSE